MTREEIMQLNTDYLNGCESEHKMNELFGCVLELQKHEQQHSVTPQQKIGHWIEEVDDYGEVMRWHCDKCYEDSGFTTTCKWDYCPNCGAKMEIDNNFKQGLNYSDADTMMPAT